MSDAVFTRATLSTTAFSPSHVCGDLFYFLLFSQACVETYLGEMKPFKLRPQLGLGGSTSGGLSFVAQEVLMQLIPTAALLACFI